VERDKIKVNTDLQLCVFAVCLLVYCIDYMEAFSVTQLYRVE
jgi:hypothetical protein